MIANAACEILERDGYCVLEDVLDGATATRTDHAARNFMQDGRGYINLEGALLILAELAPLCEAPVVLNICTHFLGDPHYLVNNVCMKWCQPDTAMGTWHADWPLGDVAQPYPAWPMLLQTMWMLTDFTEANGATWVVPGSHRNGCPPTGENMVGAVPVEGKAGALLVWLGALWHRSGANTTVDRHRMGANIAYIPRYIHRPADMWPLVPRVQFNTFSPVLQQLLERSVEAT